MWKSLISRKSNHKLTYKKHGGISGPLAHISDTNDHIHSLKEKPFFFSPQFFNFPTDKAIWKTKTK